MPTLSDYGLYAQRRLRDQPGGAAAAPLVSIVTVTLNAAATVSRTIASVRAQDDASAIEHIFVDGGSTDGTLDILRQSLRPSDYLISEPDRGISDAFNKGVALARGEFVQILNADDWLSPGQVAASRAVLTRTGADFVFGDLVFYDQDRPIFTYLGDPAYAQAIHRRMPAVSHPTVLARRSCFERVGLFDLGYRCAMDYDWLLRLHQAGGRGAYAHEILGHMTHAGVSNRQFKRTIDEIRQIATAHGRNPLLAAIEAKSRYWKTAASQPIKRHVRPLYHLVRRVTNPSYRPSTAG